jgi:hypothetical protein
MKYKNEGRIKYRLHGVSLGAIRGSPEIWQAVCSFLNRQLQTRKSFF